MKQPSFFFFYLMALACAVIACKEQKRISSYPDGRIEAEFETSGGMNHGHYKYYYQSGKLASEGTYVYGKKEGLETWYYQDGTIRRSIEWKDDKHHGQEKRFFENGNPSVTFMFTNGIQTGNEDWYYLKGGISHRMIYDEDGDVIYTLDWDSLGNKTNSMVVPIVKVSADTLRVNQECQIQVSFGYPVTGEIDFKFQSLKAKNEPHIDAVEDSVRKRFLFRLKFSEPGFQEFLIDTYHIPETGDSLSADRSAKKVRLFVMESSGI